MTSQKIKHIPNHIRLMQRLLAKDASLWTNNADTMREIEQRLGWLNAHKFSLSNLDRIDRFVTSVVEKGFDHVVLLGMGGSSLAAEVFAESFATRDGYPELTVLDSTAPDAINHVISKIEKHKPLFLVSSKSGTTAETLALYRYFREWCKPRCGVEWGSQFVAITDAGSELERTANGDQYLDVFLNPADIGGRYSALSFFGLVPAALKGVEINKLLSPVGNVLKAGSPDATFAVALGTFLGEHARNGRNKLTLLFSPRIQTLGAWVEQLIAESTGKVGRGIIPINEEPLQPVDHYRDDRVFVCVELSNQPNSSVSKAATALSGAGHPVYRWRLDDAYQLGIEFSRWQIATVIACTVLSVNPFDQPDVNATKKHTLQLLRARPHTEPGIDFDYASTPLLDLLDVADGRENRGYIAILAYLPPSDEIMSALKNLRTRIMHLTAAATCLAIGPRYLHSTGQLHKGGNDQGTFLILTADSDNDLAIPGENYGFQRLIKAQAMGDLVALKSRDRRVLHIELGKVPSAARNINSMAQSI